jgi:hypothetical protein
MATCDDFLVQPKSSWRNIIGANGVGRSERKSVHVGAIESRHVDESRNVLRQHAAERRGKRTVSCGPGDISMRLVKRKYASSAETTSRNCSCRAAQRIAETSFEAPAAFAVFAALFMATI